MKRDGFVGEIPGSKKPPLLIFTYVEPSPCMADLIKQKQLPMPPECHILHKEAEIEKNGKQMKEE